MRKVASFFLNQRLFALFLAMMMVIGNINLSFAAVAGSSQSIGIGEIIKQSTARIAPGVDLTKLEVETANGPLKIVNMAIDQRNPFIKIVSQTKDGKLAGFKTVRQHAAFISGPGHVVIGGINGDFYNTSNGIPIGSMVHDGKIIKINNSWNAFGILENGDAVIGRPNFTVTMEVYREGTVTGSVYPIHAVNGDRGSNQLILYTPEYDQSTFTNDYGTEVVLKNIQGELSVNQTVTAEVYEIYKDKGNTTLEEGTYVLSGHGTKKELLNQLQPGDKITIKTTANAPWNQVRELIGGNHLLVKDGELVPQGDKSVHPRTAVGIKADGSIFFIVVDGRQPGYSVGVSLEDLGRMMKEMGAVQALNLDGGGSATMVARQPGDEGLSVVNSPSDGGERSVANALLVVSTAPQGSLSHLTVLPDQVQVLSGSHVAFTAKGQDQYFNPIAITGKISWKVNPDFGTFDEHGVLETVYGKTGEGTVTASVGDIVGTASIKVVDRLDRIDVFPTQISANPGDTIQIKPTGYLDGQPVVADLSAFTYEIEGNIGTVDPNGLFTATQGTASGSIKVSYGATSTTIKVDVGKPPIILEDFEDGLTGWTKGGARYNSVKISLASAPEPVRFGKHSLRLDYDFTGQKGTSGAYAYPVEDIVLEGYPEKIGMWVYGAGDKHWLRAQMRDGNNAAFPIDFTDETTGINWTGWKYVEASIPKGKATPLKLDLAVRVMETSDQNKNAATIYVDNIRAVYGETNDDLTNPTLSEFFPADGSSTPSPQPYISVTAKDNPGGTGIEPARIVMRLDGKEVTPTFDESSGKISYQPEHFLAGGLHKVYVYVEDKFGNPAEAEWSFFITAGSQFLLSGPDKAEAGNVITVNLDVRNIKDLKSTYTKIKFDPTILQVVDADANTAGIQVKPGDKIDAANIKVNEADNQNGEIIFETQNLDQIPSPKADERLLSISFRVNQFAKGSIKVEMTEGKLIYNRGDERDAFVLPYTANIEFPLSVEVEGISVGTETTITVKDAQGNPVEGANIHVISPADIKHLAKIKNDGTKIYKAADPSSEQLAVVHKDELLYAIAQSGDFLQVYAKNGAKGWVQSSDAELLEWTGVIGGTDRNGQIKTNLVTLSLLAFQLQAEKDGLVSQVIEFKTVPQIGSNHPEHIVLTWKESPKTTQSITWRTAPGVTGTVLQYVPTAEFTDFHAENVKEVIGTSYLLPSGSGEMRIHEVTAVNLTPGTSYTYRVGDGKNWSDIKTFRTEPEKNEPFSFLFITDSQATTQAEFDLAKAVLEKGLAKHPDARFIIHGGDIVDDSNKMEQWEYFLNSVSDITAKVPLMAVLGNHDVMGEGEIVFKSIFQYPENGPDGEKEWAYSFDYGDVHFAMLNTEFGSDSMAKQMDWLRQDMNRTNKKWKIVVFHRPPYLSNPLRGADATKTIFAPVMEELGIDLVLNGHDHAYVRTYPMKEGKPAADGKGTIYIIGGSSGPKFYPENKYDYIDVLYGEDKQVFTSIQVDGNKLHIEATTIDGQVIDQFTMEKDAAELQSIKLSGLEPMKVGETRQAVVEAVYSDGKVIPVTSGVIFTSSDETVATVTNTGWVSALKEGETIIKAVYNGKEAVYTLVVSKAPKAPAITLAGPDTIMKNQEFTVMLGIEGVADSVYKNVYAQDITISFDADKFEFVDAVSLNDGLYVGKKSDNPGKVRLIIAVMGPQYAITDQAQLLNLTFRAKNVPGHTGNIAVVSAVLSDGDGHEFNATLTQKSIEITGIAGDLNNDGRITIGDLAIVAKYYGKKSGEMDWEKAIMADINNDGSIGLEDLVEIARKILS